MPSALGSFISGVIEYATHNGDKKVYGESFENAYKNIIQHLVKVAGEDKNNSFSEEESSYNARDAVILKNPEPAQNLQSIKTEIANIISKENNLSNIEKAT